MALVIEDRAMLTLYYAPRTCSLAPFIALEETGAAFESYRVNFAEGEQNSAKYKAINPKGRVPALVTPQGIVSENVAILAFIAQSFPESKLAPTDLFVFAQMQALNAYLASTVHVGHAHKLRGHRWSDDPAVIDGVDTSTLVKTLAHRKAMLARPAVARAMEKHGG
jgi:glutathione S-transferase